MATAGMSAHVIVVHFAGIDLVIIRVARHVCPPGEGLKWHGGRHPCCVNSASKVFGLVKPLAVCKELSLPGW